MINNSTIVGRLTDTPELRQTGTGVAVTNLTVAVERSFKNAQGERETDFIRCIAWRKTAEIIAKLAYKGSLVGVVGAIETGRYENNEGRTVYTTEINVDSFQMLEPKSVTDERRGGQSAKPSYQKKQPSKDDNPFANVNFDKDDTTDISDDDLPF